MTDLVPYTTVSPPQIKSESRYDWSLAEIQSIYTLTLSELIFRAQATHRQFHRNNEIQACALLSVKTGGCPENCAYCPQSAHYDTGLKATALSSIEDTLKHAREAKAAGATRFCIGAAWRDVPNGEAFDEILELVRGVRALDMEACCTLGMLTDNQARALATAGLSAYNHNLDTSPEYYPRIITTRRYHDRLATLARVRRAGITVCCGGIVGMGESRSDRFSLLQQLSSLRPHPESIPINMLVRVEGTPLAKKQPLDSFELVRTIATARVLMPRSTIRLSAGRLELADEAQALCFVAGANSIFFGEQLLTTPNPERNKDLDLLSRLGLKLQTRSRQELKGVHERKSVQCSEENNVARPITNDWLDSLHNYR